MPDVLGVWTALGGLEDGAGGAGGICIGRDDGAAPGGVCMWAPFVLLEVADADATGTTVLLTSHHFAKTWSETR